MAKKHRTLWLLAVIFVLTICHAEGGGSLRSALEALQRRQRGQPNHFEDYGDLVEIYGPKEQLLAERIYNSHSEGGPEIPKPRVPRLHKDELYEEIKSSKHKPSPFRERNIHNEEEKEVREESELEKYNDEVRNDVEYAALLEKLWSKYKSKESPSEELVRLYHEGKVKKSQYHTLMEPTTLKKKRSSSSKSNSQAPLPDDYFKFASSVPERQQKEANEFDYPISETDDSSSDLRDEYTIAFQPFDNDRITEVLTNDDSYAYNTDRLQIAKRSSGPMPANLAKLSERATEKSLDDSEILNSEKIPGDLLIPQSEKEDNSHEFKTVKLNSGNQNYSKTSTKINVDDSHENQRNKGDHGIQQGQVKNVDIIDDIEQPLKVAKKSIDWSQYFGIDKRSRHLLNGNDFHDQYLQKFSDEMNFPLMSKRHDHKDSSGIFDGKALFDGSEDTSSKATQNRDKIEEVDKSLKTMESEIVEEALNISNLGEADIDTAEQRELKEKMLSKLAAAYSVERMRSALRELKQSLEKNKNLFKSSRPSKTTEVKEKRISVKKEKVILTPEEINAMKTTPKTYQDDFESEQGAGHYLNGQPFGEAYMGSGRQQKSFTTKPSSYGECPVMDKILQRCRGIDFLSEDQGSKFQPMCSMHQICYLCGRSSATTCDLTYLSEVDTECDGNTQCQQAARASLMAMQDLHEASVDELDGECEASPCINAAVQRDSNWHNVIYG